MSRYLPSGDQSRLPPIPGRPLVNCRALVPSAFMIKTSYSFGWLTAMAKAIEVPSGDQSAATMVLGPAYNKSEFWPVLSTVHKDVGPSAARLANRIFDPSGENDGEITFPIKFVKRIRREPSKTNRNRSNTPPF